MPFVIGKSKKALVDILVLVDTSPSMYHHLEKLGISLSHFLSAISDYDWQMAFTSVDHGDHQAVSEGGFYEESWRDHISDLFPSFGSLMQLEDGESVLNQRILTSQTPNYQDIFFHTLSHSPERNCYRPPYCHEYLEQPLRSLKSALERSFLDNKDFFRPQADFVSLIITNEGERDEDKERATSAKEVQKTFYEVFPSQAKKFLAFNIIVKDRSCLKEENEKGERASLGEQIGELADLTGGENMSICSDTYDSFLQVMSQHIKSSLENSLVLSENLIPETLELEFEGGRQIPWDLYGRKIVFREKIEEKMPGWLYYRVFK